MTRDPNSPEAWNTRFQSQSWHKAGGSIQSLSFYLHALDHLKTLPDFHTLSDYERFGEDGISAPFFTVHDYGCAAGDGTALLKAIFFSAEVVGFDHSSEAVREARARWPTLSFEVGDIRDPEPADIIWTSHTLEHLPDPASVVKTCLERCSLLVVVVPPIPDESVEESGAEHKDAIPFKEWRAEVPKPGVEASYNVVRINPTTGHMLEEGNVLMVWS